MFNGTSKERRDRPPNEFDQDVSDMDEKISAIKEDEYRLFFKIIKKELNQRISDYYTIKINNYNPKTDNYLTASGKLVFNNAVKNKLKKNIEMQMNPEDAKDCRSVLIALKKKRDFLFEQVPTQTPFNKKTVNIAKQMGIKGGATQFRKIALQHVPNLHEKLEVYAEVEEIARVMNTSVPAINQYYLSKKD